MIHACMQVSLQPATLRVHCAGTVVNGYPPRETSAISFDPCMPAVPAAMSLQVGVAMTEADMPLPPQLRAPRQPDKLEGPLVRLFVSIPRTNLACLLELYLKACLDLGCAGENLE